MLESMSMEIVSRLLSIVGERCLGADLLRILLFKSASSAIEGQLPESLSGLVEGVSGRRKRY